MSGLDLERLVLSGGPLGCAESILTGMLGSQVTIILQVDAKRFRHSG